MLCKFRASVAYAVSARQPGMHLETLSQNQKKLKAKNELSRAVSCLCETVLRTVTNAHHFLGLSLACFLRLGHCHPLLLGLLLSWLRV